MAEQRTVDGRYRLDKIVGSGGMGVVWRAFDLRLGRTVAVKEVRFPSAMTDEERTALTKRAMLEAQSAGRLDHPNIVPVHDVILQGEQPFIIMRFVEGRSLDQTVAAEGPLPAHVVARIGVQLLDALGAAHDSDVIHRDVKPHNVLIQPDGTAQLTDFSIASVFGTETLTKTGALLGSPGYIAPERLMNGATTPAGDLFALGATLFFAAEGVGPFVAKETIAGLFASATRPHPRPKHAGPRLTPVIDGLLEKNPDDRLDRPRARALLKSIADAPDEDAPETRSGEFMPPPLGRVDTDDNPDADRGRRGGAPPEPQGDPASESSTAVFVPPQSRPYDSGDVVRPASGGTVYGRPVSGAPTSGTPVSGAPVSGAPRNGAPGSGRPVSGGAVYGRPISGVPASGGPGTGGAGAAGPSSGGAVYGGAVYGRPISSPPGPDQPVSGAPGSGAPGSGAPVSGGPGGGGSGARELAWGPGGVAGGPADTGPTPSFRSPAAPSSPPAGQRWKRALAVLTIIVLGLGAGIIANLVATQDRSKKATRTGTAIEDTGADTGVEEDEPTPQPTPGAPKARTTGAEPSPDETLPDTKPSTSRSSETTKAPPPPPDAKVISVSLSVTQPPNSVDCSAPLTISISVSVKTNGATTVNWSVFRGGAVVVGDIAQFTEADTNFTTTRSETISSPKPGAYSYTLESRTPNVVTDGPRTIEITCVPTDVTVTPKV